MSDTSAKAAAIRLDRRVFATSRLAEFTSQKELTAQTGHTPDQWPLVIVKELVDNALDEAERVGIAPELELQVDNDRIVVTDNGGGIASETVAKILDYTVRASDKEAYVSPTRGAQGNALKTVLAMPFALDGTTGRTVIESRGICHDITFTIDPIRREPKIEHTTEPSLVKNGTRITVHLPNSPLVTRGRPRLLVLTSRAGLRRAQSASVAGNAWLGADLQQQRLDQMDAGRSDSSPLV